MRICCALIWFCWALERVVRRRTILLERFFPLYFHLKYQFEHFTYVKVVHAFIFDFNWFCFCFGFGFWFLLYSILCNLYCLFGMSNWWFVYSLLPYYGVESVIVDTVEWCASIASTVIDSTQMTGFEIDVVFSLVVLALLRLLPCLFANRKLLTDRCHLDVSPVLLCWNRLFLLAHSLAALRLQQWKHKHLYIIVLNAIRKSFENKAYTRGLIALLQ